MVRYSLDVLKKKFNERVKFEINFLLADKSFFKNIFYAYLREVTEDYIIVEEFYVKSDGDFKEEMAIQKRKLKHGDFIILNGK